MLSEWFKVKKGTNSNSNNPSAVIYFNYQEIITNSIKKLIILQKSTQSYNITFTIRLCICYKSSKRFSRRCLYNFKDTCFSLTMGNNKSNPKSDS